MRGNRIFNVLLLGIIILVIIGPVVTVVSHADRGQVIYGGWHPEKEAWMPRLDGEGVYATENWGEAQRMCDYVNTGTEGYVPAVMNAGRPLMIVRQAQRTR